MSILGARKALYPSNIFTLNKSPSIVPRNIFKCSINVTQNRGPISVIYSEILDSGLPQETI
jgi:hypothetical protein